MRFESAISRYAKRHQIIQYEVPPRHAAAQDVFSLIDCVQQGADHQRNLERIPHDDRCIAKTGRRHGFRNPPLSASSGRIG